MSAKGLVVIDTWEGPCLLAFGRCRVCGWEGHGPFADVELVRRPDGVYEFDAEPEAACPRCGIHECEVDVLGDRFDPIGPGPSRRVS